MIKRILLLFFALCLFCASLLVTIPAQQILSWVSLPVGISIAGVKGNVNEGSVSQVVVNGTKIENLKWVWKPTILFTGKLAFDWTIRGQKIQGEGQILCSLFGPIQLKATELEMNSRLFNSQLPEGITSNGQLNLRIIDAEFEDRINRLEAILTGRSINIESPAGSFYQAKIDSSIQGGINDQYTVYIVGGEKQKNYNLQFEIDPNGEISGSGVIKKETPLAQQLSSVLPLIAQQQGHQWKINWTSRLPSKFVYYIRDVP